MRSRAFSRQAAAAAGLVALAFLAAPMAAARAQQAEQTVDLDRRTGLALTVYNADLALVRDVRLVELDEGMNRLAFAGVSARLRPETASLEPAAEGATFRVVEQSFDFDPISRQKLLEASVGGSVRVVRTHPVTGAESFQEATVLSVADGVVLQIGDRIETDVPGRLVFDKLPAGLRANPTLVVTLASPLAASAPLALSYLSGGLSWRADYVGELDPAEKRLDLKVWATLSNTSGSSYPDARLQLVAGDVNLAEPLRPPTPRAAMSMARAEAAAPEMREESVSDYHLYSLDRPVTLAQNQTKQIALLTLEGVPVTKEYRLESALQLGPQPQTTKPAVGAWLLFANDVAAGAGEPLPRGVVRIYRRQRAGGVVFLGADRLDQTPTGGAVELRLGRTFDLAAERRQTDFTRPGADRDLFEAGYEVVLKNGGDAPATVVVRETIPGDWEMLAESHKHTKRAANQAEWRIDVPAAGAATLSYRVRVRR